MINTKLNLRLPSIVLGLALASIGLGGCASDRSVISQADQAHTELKPAVMNDAELNEYLQGVGDRIITAAKKLDAKDYGPDSHRKEDPKWMFSKDMKFHFVNSKTLNAFTTGGEHMYIYNELFQQCKSEDELAAVMAHEYGHVYARHVEQGMNRQTGLLIGAAGVGAAGYAAGGSEHGAEYGAGAFGGAMALGQFIGMGFTRKDEAQADELGFNFYAHAGWDPNHFADFFQHMIDMGFDKTPEVASDHPSLASRVEEAKKNIAALPAGAKEWQKAPIADDKKFKKLQARAKDLGKTLPSDQSMEKAQKLLASFGNCIVPADQPEQVQARKELSGLAQEKNDKRKSSKQKK